MYFLFDLFCDFVNYIYEIPMVKRITKRSIMGNIIDKTMDYYISSIQLSPLDDKYLIKYNYMSKDFLLSCKGEHFKSAIKYIKSLSISSIVETSFYKAYELSYIGPLDITNRMRMFAGPLGNFYKDTDFYITPEDVTENETVLVVLNNLDVLYPNRYKLIEII